MIILLILKKNSQSTVCALSAIHDVLESHKASNGLPIFRRIPQWLSILNYLSSCNIMYPQNSIYGLDTPRIPWCPVKQNGT